MSTLLDVTEKLNDTQAMIRMVTDQLKSDPANPALLASLRSLTIRAERLEDDFVSVAGQDRLDICSYRIHGDQDLRLPVGALGDALRNFQKWFSLVYDGLVNGPKSRARLTPEMCERTTLDFGFTYSGSVGVALTVPRQRLLFDVHLEEAMKMTTEMLKAESSEQIHHFAEKVGPASVRALYEVASSHAMSGTGAELRWLHDSSEVSSANVEADHMVNLSRAIDETSDHEEVELTLSGVLVGADTSSHSFHMAFDGDDTEEIRGKMSDDIGHEYTVELPKRYVAKIRKTSFVNYATEKESTSYFLISLSEKK